MKKEIRNSLKWDLLGKVSTQLSTFAISIILARILVPEDYGLLGMAMAFTGIAGNLINMGFGSAIVQSKTIKRIDINSVIIVNISIGLVLTIIFYLLSNLIGAYYENDTIGELAQVLSITFLINSLSVTSVALLEKELNFKSLSLSRLFAGIISGVFGVILAYKGYGVWSLVYSSIINESLRTLFVIYKVNHKFKFEFSFNSVKSLWGFGSKMFLSGLLETIYLRVDYLITGKYFSAELLGYYYRAKSFRALIVRYTSDTIGKVFFPVFSQKQDDIDWIRAAFEKSFRYIFLLSVLICGILFSCSNDIFLLLFSEKWLPSVVHFNILMSAAVFLPLLALLSNVINGLGYSKEFLQFNMIEKGIYILAIIVSVMSSNFMIFIASEILIKGIAFVLYFRKAQDLVKFEMKTLIKILVSTLVLIILCILFIDIIQRFLVFNVIIKLLIKSFLFILLFIVGLQLPILRSYYDIESMIKKINSKKSL